MCACLVTVSRNDGIYCADCGRLIHSTPRSQLTHEADLRQALQTLIELTSALAADHSGYVVHTYWQGLPSQPPAPDEVPSLELRLKVFAAIKSAKEILHK